MKLMEPVSVPVPALQLASKRHGRQVPSLAFGGDHTISIGTFLAARARDPTTRLVWIDAHPDINTPDSSTTGAVIVVTVGIFLSRKGQLIRFPHRKLPRDASCLPDEPGGVVQDARAQAEAARNRVHRTEVGAERITVGYTVEPWVEEAT